MEELNREQKKQTKNPSLEPDVIYRDRFIAIPAKKEPKPTMVTEVGNFTASLINGQWFYKAKEVFPLQSGVIKKWKDPVQLPLMEEYELAAEIIYKSQLKTMVLEIVSYLKDL